MTSTTTACAARPQRTRRLSALGLATAGLAAAALPLLAPSPAAATLRTFVAANVTADGQGYLMTGDRGENYAFGTMTPQANPAGFSGRIVDTGATADGRGTLALSSTGQFYATGSARPFPNPTGFSGEMAAVAVTADGQGAVAMSTAGQFYAYGTATPQPNPVGFSGRMVDVALTADGRGLTALSSAGQFYTYGTATPQLNPSGFSGEMRAVDLTADGRGLMAVSSAGQYYAYGTAKAQTNPAGFSGSIVDLDLTADGQGVMAISSSGQGYHAGTVTPRGNADPGTEDALGSRIAALALQQAFVERNGDNCNPYTHELGGGSSSGCPAGQRYQQWCADFAEVMWKRSGARVDGITPAAKSFAAVPGFRSGATNNPRVGDAIVWGGNGHVGVVVEVASPSRVKVTHGNISNRVYTEWLDPTTKVYNGGKVLGYTTPRPL